VPPILCDAIPAATNATARTSMIRGSVARDFNRLPVLGHFHGCISVRGKLYEVPSGSGAKTVCVFFS
jgi:hypothetical protein